MRNILPLLPLPFLPPSAPQSNFPSFSPTLHSSLSESTSLSLPHLSPSSPSLILNLIFIPSLLPFTLLSQSIFSPSPTSSPSFSHLEFGSSGWHNRRGYLLLRWLSQVHRCLRLPCYFRLQGEGDTIIGKEEEGVRKIERTSRFWLQWSYIHGWCCLK